MKWCVLYAYICSLLSIAHTSSICVTYNIAINFKNKIFVLNSLNFIFWRKIPVELSKLIHDGSFYYSYFILGTMVSTDGWLVLEMSIFSCDQAALWMVQSVRLSVCLSVCLSVTPFWLCSRHRIIMKFSGVITNDKSDVHAKGQGQRSKVKVTEVNTQLNRFRTVTPVWIHIWWWNDAYSLMMLRRGALLFLKVIRQISRSHGSKKRRILPRLGDSGL